MADFFATAPEPETALYVCIMRHRILSPTAGVKVSPLCLGTMGFGEAHKEAMGECTKETAFEIFDWFRAHGGNFIDTSCNYQEQESEQWLGEWMASRKCRDEMFIATKFSTYNRELYAQKDEIPSAFMGNSTKTLRNHITRSCENLRTDYVDLLYVHWWECSTSVEELMQSLNREVAAGRVLYLGVSDTPGYIVARANQYARDHALRQFSVYQGLWNCATRDMEREIIPACLSDGMAICPWRVMGGGGWKTEAQKAAPDGRKVMLASPAEQKMQQTLQALADKRGTKITSIALAFVMASAPDVYPLVGVRKLQYLIDAVDALNIRLTPEELAQIRDASDFDPGFPLAQFMPGVPPLDVTPASHVCTRNKLQMDLTTRRGPAFPPRAK